MAKRLILASESPRRKELLKRIGLKFHTIPSRVEEKTFPGESLEGHALRLAEEKAREVGARYPESWVIAADTVVHIGGSILGKPKDREEALEMLRRLSGREHRVVTGFSVLHSAEGKGDKQTVETTVKMMELNPVEMEWYVKTGEPFDKAGGYAVQGIGSFMIESIRGSYTNVVGLPLFELVRMLVRLEAVTIAESGFRIN
jgi:septum formation protein